MPTEGGGGMGWFSKPKAAAPDRLVMDMHADGYDGAYETSVRGEAPHRAHLVSVLAKHKRSRGYAVGMVPVRGFIIPLLDDERGQVAVEIEGVQVGMVSDQWVKLFGHTYATAARAASKPVAFAVQAAICWDERRGDPLKDSSIPVGVRLDLEDQAVLDDLMLEDYG